MKILAIAALAASLTACSFTPTYQHDPETHERAVRTELPPVAPGVRRPVAVSFAVEPDGRVSAIYASGGHKGDRSRAQSYIENTAPFPPHTGNGPIWYSVSFGTRLR